MKAKAPDMLLFSQSISSPWIVAFVSMTVLIAAWTDWRNWRIPNALVAGSMAAALMHAAFGNGGIGIAECIAGGLLGLGMFLPLYLLKGMAAGDVKLMAAIGMHVGPLMTIDIALATCLVGGAWALVLLDLKKGTGPMSWLVFQLRSVTKPSQGPGTAHSSPGNTGRDRLAMIPYGVVIAIGTLGVIGLAQR